MRKIGVVTVARSDYGTYLPLLKKITQHPKLKLLLYVTGMHLSNEFGKTVRVIREDGYPIADEIEMLISDDSPAGIAKSMGIATMGFSQTLKYQRPDILVVLGDRFEMHAACTAALPFKIPIAHIHGGELTLGLIDEYFRHSLTKFSHLHFVSTEIYARRVIQMGEEPWRVFNFGALGVDNIMEMHLYTKEELEKQYSLDLSKPIILVTFHPVTLEYEKTDEYICQLLSALNPYTTTHSIIFTSPNADTKGKIIIKSIQDFCLKRKNVFFIINFGQRGYLSLLKSASVMVGNSSSAFVETPSFRLPVVNIGSRQTGRIRCKNMIDVGYSSEEIQKGLRLALSTEFKNSLHDLKNPYGDGNAANRIVSILEKVNSEELLPKRFYDIQTFD